MVGGGRRFGLRGGGSCHSCRGSSIPAPGLRPRRISKGGRVRPRPCQRLRWESPLGHGGGEVRLEARQDGMGHAHREVAGNGKAVAEGEHHLTR
jgi:hypothetical protein